MKKTSGSYLPRQTGFTLIELLIVVALIAILSAIAIPFFGDVLSRARRADAKDALLGAQMAQEKFRANCPHYAATIGAAHVCTPATNTYQMIDPGAACPSLPAAAADETYSPDCHYRVTLAAAATITYNVTAVPVGTQAGDKCGTFAVKETGEDYSGTYADEECWKR